MPGFDQLVNHPSHTVVEASIKMRFDDRQHVDCRHVVNAPMIGPGSPYPGTVAGAWFGGESVKVVTDRYLVLQRLLGSN